MTDCGREGRKRRIIIILIEAAFMDSHAEMIRKTSPLEEIQFIILHAERLVPFMVIRNN